jgi:hypothetical protein
MLQNSLAAADGGRGNLEAESKSGCDGGAAKDKIDQDDDRQSTLPHYPTLGCASPRLLQRGLT